MFEAEKQIMWMIVGILILPVLSFAVQIENRPLIPTSTLSRSPAEAGLESGRYQEIPVEALEEWERKQDRAEESAAISPAKVESNFSSPPADR